MKIQIEDKLYIESDDRQFIVKQYSGKFDKEENETFKVLGYFGKLSQAAEHLVKLEIFKSTATSLKELLIDIKRIEQRIEELIRH